MSSTPSLSRFNALLREHVNALHLRLKEMQVSATVQVIGMAERWGSNQVHLQEQEEEESEKKNIEEDRRSLAEQVQSIVNETVDKDMYAAPSQCGASLC